MKLQPIATIAPLAAALTITLAGCAAKPEPAPAAPRSLSTYKAVLPLLETNCCHCHGPQRLPTMPPLTNTEALATLIGPGKIIVPGQPENSRFFKVVTLSDNEAGAMPPTGHAVTKREIESLRSWIAAGAPVPPGIQPLTPRGMAPRSR
jgi:mono/diheme cytochrome c family protein